MLLNLKLNNEEVSYLLNTIWSKFEVTTRADNINRSKLFPCRYDTLYIIIVTIIN